MIAHKALQLLGNLTSHNKLSILIFHQVMGEPDPFRPTEPTVDIFRWQMGIVRDYFNPVALGDAVSLLKERRLPANSICITFDDGYLDNLTLAQPVLEEMGLPATVFVSTAFSGGENMWNDRLIDLVSDMHLDKLDLSPMLMESQTLSSTDQRRQLIKELIAKLKYQEMTERKQVIDELYRVNHIAKKPSKMMTPGQVKELSEKGIEIGAHTVDHPILMAHDARQQKSQITGSKQTLEDWIQKPVTGFAYPNGKKGVDYDATAAAIVAESGFDYAVATDWGVSTPDTSPFELKRFSPWDRSPAKYHLRLIRNQLGR